MAMRTWGRGAIALGVVAGVLAMAGSATAARRTKRKRGKQPKAAAAPAPKPAPAPAPEPAGPPAPALPTGYRAVAVLPLEGIDVGDELLRTVEHALLDEIDEAEGFRGVSPRDVQSDLDGFGMSAAGCEGETACLARAGRYARAHLALEARLAAIGGTLNVSLRLVDTVAAAEVARVAEVVSDSLEERAAELHRLAVQLLAPDTYKGTLVIDCGVDGAEVYLDEALIGQTPLPGPLAGLRAGPHILRVSKAGHADLYRFVDVTYRRSSTLTVDLDNTTISGQILELESKKLGKLYVTAQEPGIELRIDGEPVGRTIFEAPIEVSAGPHRISLRREGAEPVQQELVIEQDRRTEIAVATEGETIDIIKVEVVAADAPLMVIETVIAAQGAQVAVAPPPAATPEAAPPPARSSWKLWAGIVTGGLGVAGLGVWGYFAAEVKRLDDRARGIETEARASGVTSAQLAVLDAERTDVDSQGNAAMTGEWVTLGVGAGLVAVGGVLLLWELMSAGTEAAATEAAPVQVGVLPTPTGTQVSVRASW